MRTERAAHPATPEQPPHLVVHLLQLRRHVHKVVVHVRDDDGQRGAVAAQGRVAAAAQLLLLQRRAIGRQGTGRQHRLQLAHHLPAESVPQRGRAVPQRSTRQRGASLQGCAHLHAAFPTPQRDASCALLGMARPSLPLLCTLPPALWPARHAVASNEGAVTQLLLT